MRGAILPSIDVGGGMPCPYRLRRVEWVLDLDSLMIVDECDRVF
jgi:hypothetical protein